MSKGVEISKRLVLINSTSSIVERLINISVLLWLQAWLMRQVSADENELYRVVLSLLVFVPLLTGILGGALARFVTAAYARHDERHVTEIVSTMFPICALGGALILAVGLPLSWFVDSVIEVGRTSSPEEAHQLLWQARIMLAVLTVMSAARVTLTPFRLGMNVRQKFIWMHAISLSSELIRISVLFALLFGLGTKAMWVVVAMVPAGIYELSLGCSLSVKLVPCLRYRRDAFRRDLFKPILSYGWWTLMIRLVVMLRETISLLMLQRFTTSPVETVVYTNGSMVDNQIRKNSLIMMPAVQPALTAMHVTGQHDRLRRTYFRFSRYLLWIFVGVAIPLLVFREEVWRLYLGHKFDLYAASVTVMVPFLVRFLFMYPQASISAISMAMGDSRPVALCSTAIEVGTLLLGGYFVIVRHEGAQGLAMSVLLSSAVLQPLLFWPFGLRLTKARLPDFLRATLVPAIAPGLVGTAVWLAMAWWHSPTTWTMLGLEVGAGVLAYLGTIYAFCLEPHERADVVRVLQKLRGLVPGRKGA